MQEFTVEFRVYGSDLDPSTVTATLGLQPSLKREVGDRRDETTTWKEGMWSYNGFPETAGAITWPSLEEGLGVVLEKLLPKKDALQIYKDKYEMVLWCGHFQTDSNGSITLSPEILAKLGEFGVELF